MNDYDSFCVTMRRTMIPGFREIQDLRRRLAFLGGTYATCSAAVSRTLRRALLYDREKRILETEGFIPLGEA